MVLLSTGIDWKRTLFFAIGGFGIFLFGIELTGDSLKLLAGDRLKRLIEKSTGTPLKGLLMGILVTALLQTSSGTTALTVGLVRAGLMTMPQAVGVILGANIGTTITSFLIGLNIQAIALPIIGVGGFMHFMFKTRRLKRGGGALFGFGLIFYGLDLMGSSLSVFAEQAAFKNMLETVSDWPALGVVTGAILTALVQSSTATIGIMQALYATGAVPLIGAIAIVFGSNIGTTITAIFASAGGSVAAKRTALAHVFFNVGGTLILLLFIRPYAWFISQLEIIFLQGEPRAMSLSLAHIFFNVFAAFVALFFVGALVRFSKKLIPGQDVMEGIDVSALQTRLIKASPPLALENAKRVIINMGAIVKDMYVSSVKFSFAYDKLELENGRQLEEVVDTIDQKVHDYLVQVSHLDLDDKSAHLHARYVDAIRDFERIADHCQNLYDFFNYRHESKQILSEDAQKDLHKLYEVVEETLLITLEAFENDDRVRAEQVLEYEDVIDNLVRKYRKRHVQRMHLCTTPECSDELFVDILSNVERIGDHCTNIVHNVLHENYYHGDWQSETSV